MCSVDQCEVEWILGAVGSCNFSDVGDAICVCPPGFTGEDDWESFLSCSVDTNIQTIYHIVGIALAGVGSLLITIAALFFSSETGFVPPPATIMRTGSRYPSRKPSQSPSLNASQNNEAVMKSRRLSIISPPERISELPTFIGNLQFRDWKRKRETLCSYFMFLLSSICAICYYVPFFYGVKRFHFLDSSTVSTLSYMQNLALAIAVPGIFAAFFLQVKSWFDTIPEIRKFGGMFHINRMMIKFPQMVNWITLISNIIVFSSSISCFFVLPLLLPEMYELWNAIMLGVVVTMLAVYTVLLNLVVCSVRRMLRGYLDTGELDASHLAMKSSIRVSTFLIIGSWIGFVLASGMISLTFTEIGRRHMYILFNSIVGMAYVTVLILVGVTSTQTAGGLSPSARITRKKSRLIKKTKTQGTNVTNVSSHANISHRHTHASAMNAEKNYNALLSENRDGVDDVESVVNYSQDKSAKTSRTGEKKSHARI